MKIIKNITPKSRCQQDIEYDDGSKVVRCFSPANPQYCHKDGVLQPIDLRILDSFDSGVGPAVKTTDNVTTVGVRTDGKPFKLIGFRPDSKQDGTHQLELTLDRVTINGVGQDLTLHAPETKLSQKGSACVDVGACQIYTDRRCGRILTPLDSNTTSFEIAYTGTFTGCHLGYVGTAPAGYWGIFADDANEFLWRFSAPLFVDETYAPLKDADGNSLDKYVTFAFSDNGDGTYTYMKSSTADFDASLFPANYFVDAEIVYSSTSDGAMTSKKDTWSDCRNAAIATYDVSDNQINNVQAVFTNEQFGLYYFCGRSVFDFDTSGVTSLIDSVNLMIYGNGYKDAKVYAQKSTHNIPISGASYSAFSGNAYNSATSWDINVYNSIPFNSIGISDLNLAGLTKVMIRSDYDYEDITPTGYRASGCYFTDNAGINKDPYLEITACPPVMITTSIDAIIKKTGVAHAGMLDSILMAHRNRTSALDGRFSASRHISAASDAWLLSRNIAMSSDIGAIIERAGISHQVLIDACTLTPGILVNALMDTQILSREVASAMVHAMIAATRNVKINMDAALLTQLETITSLDVSLQNSIIAHCMCDVLLQQVVFHGRVAIDAALIYHGEGTTSIDAVIWAWRSVVTSFNALLAYTGAYTASMDANVFPIGYTPSFHGEVVAYGRKFEVYS